jgi:uncharacterized protein (TIGR03435 family)
MQPTRTSSVILLSILFVSAPVLQPMLAAQDKPVSNLTFEVSTVKPDTAGSQSYYLNLERDGVKFVNAPLLFLLQYAYKLNGGLRDRLIGAPSWISSTAFDVEAKMDEATAAKLAEMSSELRDETLRSMTQELLAGRFQLKVHHKNRELGVMALVVSKNGPKLAPAPKREAADPSKPRSPDDWTGLHNPRDGLMEGRDAPIAYLVNALSTKPEIGGRLVIDKTGLEGTYNFDLHWSSDSGRAAEHSDESGPSLFTALQEQLGLKLESQKAPVDCIVIDHIEQPSPN